MAAGLWVLGLVAAACYPNPDDLRRSTTTATGGASGTGGATGTAGTAGGVGGVGATGGRSGTGGGPGTGGRTGTGGGLGAGGRVGAGGAGGGFAGAGLALTPDATGWIDKATNAYGVQGNWYGFSDGIGANGLTSSGSCEMAGHPVSACSAIISPSPTGNGFPNVGGRMCATGVAARVVANTTTGLPDYGAIYGAVIGFDFNFDPGTLTKGRFNALAPGLTGIAFDIDVLPANGMRVQMVNPGTDFGPGGPAYWGGTPAFSNSPVRVGTNRIYWADIVGPYGLGLDPTQLVSMYFAVPTQAASASNFSFCISNVTLIKDTGPPGRTCTSQTFPVYCPALNGAPANCWTAGTNCSSVVSCAGTLRSCSSQAQTDFYDCAISSCRRCADPNPQACPARGTVPAGCWPNGIFCSTVTDCGGGLVFGCYDPSLIFDCVSGLCF